MRRPTPPSRPRAATRSTGQLGTYVWLESGSDSPWLRGAPLAVGAGEPLTVSFIPDGDIGAWSARYVPAVAQGPGGAIMLGQGTGSPSFPAPGAGYLDRRGGRRVRRRSRPGELFWQLEVE